MRIGQKNRWVQVDWPRDKRGDVAQLSFSKDGKTAHFSVQDLLPPTDEFGALLLELEASGALTILH